ncbi:hypothetical protein V5O48_004378 [Marasmius crinis-equi]|uniref:AA9 family lytic polysaccharide monooxygenase n=1 Tax=Marasmius crinis-equi TaxID=585013 RepID=A0ABR3FQ92_9AGAR
MRTAALFTLLCSATAALAHTRIWGVWVNGEFQGDGRDIYIRSPETNFPVKDINSKDMVCNTKNRVVPQSVNVKSGDKLTFEWYHESRRDDIITDTHLGAVQVYIAPASSDLSGKPIWTKIFSDTYDKSSKKWATIRLKKTKGQHYVTVPDIPSAEIIALHQATDPYYKKHDKGAEFYMSCVQIHINNSSPSQKLPGGTSFPGTYKYDSSVVWSLWGPKERFAPELYVAPGPNVWDGAKKGEIEKV